MNDALGNIHFHFSVTAHSLSPAKTASPAFSAITGGGKLTPSRHCAVRTYVCSAVRVCVCVFYFYVGVCPHVRERVCDSIFIMCTRCALDPEQKKYACTHTCVRRAPIPIDSTRASCIQSRFMRAYW